MITKQDLKQHLLWCVGEKCGVQIKLIGAYLAGADLAGANLTKSVLTEANLTEADLTDANLTKADLTKANLRKSDLMWANLMGANLTEADLTEADLRGANLTDAYLIGSDLRGANLTEAIGLWGVERQVEEATRIYALLQIEGNRLEMGYWHTCATAHCIAGWSCPDIIGPGGEASRKLPLLARFFFSENGIAEEALRLLAHGLIDELNNLEHA